MRALAALIAMLLSLSAAPTPSAAELQPHRAVYEVELARPGPRITNALGVYILEIGPSCDGWLTKTRLRLKYQLADGFLPDTEVIFSSTEFADGQRFRFSGMVLVNGSMVDQYRGDATRPAPDAAGTAIYLTPPATRALPAGTAFPTAHLRSLAAAVPGEGASPRKPTEPEIVFDPVRRNDTPFAARLAPDNETHTGPAIDNDPRGLTSGPWRRLNIDYAPTAAPAAPPAYHLRIDLQANGIARAFTLEQGDIALDYILYSVSPLPPADCG